MGQRAHLVSTPRWVKVHMSVKAQKKRNKKCQKSVQKFFQKKFSTQNFEETSTLAIFGQKFD